MDFSFKSIDHVQLAAPKGSEEKAREFYQGVLDFQEIEKPEALKKNGGVWFQTESIQIHIGIEEPFVPAKKAHPAFSMDNLSAFINHLEDKNVNYQKDDKLPGADRIYIWDPFGNRIEILEWKN